MSSTLPWRRAAQRTVCMRAGAAVAWQGRHRSSQAWGASWWSGRLSRVRCGRLTESNKYTQEQLQLMRTQDIGYINTKAQTDAKVPPPSPPLFPPHNTHTHTRAW